MKLKRSELAELRRYLLSLQEGRCAICKCYFDEGYYHRKKGKIVPKHIPCLDHSHTTGQIRGVLCSGCNSLEGKVINALTRWHTNVDATDAAEVSSTLYALAHYMSHHSVDRNCGKLHPLYKSTEDKRLSKNRKAKAKRKTLKT